MVVWRFFGGLALVMMIAGVVLVVVAPRETVTLDPSLTSGDVPTTSSSTTIEATVASATTSSTTPPPTTTRTSVPTSRAPGLVTSTTAPPLATRPVPSLNGGDRPREDEGAAAVEATTVAFAAPVRSTTRILTPTDRNEARMPEKTVPLPPATAPATAAPSTTPTTATPSTAAPTTAGPSTTPTSRSTAAVVPPTCDVVFGLAGASTLWSPVEVDRFAAATGQTPLLVVGYASLTGPVPVDGVRRALDRGALPVITLEPWFGDDPIAAINRGELDDDLRRWGAELARIDDPVPVRFGHEMNGFWYPWGSSTTDPASFSDAFRRVRTLLTRSGAEIEMMWSPNVVIPGQGRLADWYPGDDVVDQIGLSGYAELSGLTDATAVFGPSLDELAGLAPGTPVFLAETASATPDRRGEWIDSLLRVADRPGVAGVAWFDVDKDRTWSLSGDAAAATRFGDGVRARSC